MFASIIAMSAMICSCGTRTEIPNGFVGKVKLKEGFEDQIRYPSSFRLPWAVSYRPELVLLEVSHFPVEEKLTLFMPKDKLNLTFDVRGTLFVDPKKANDLFSVIPAEEWRHSTSWISAEKVYNTYGRQLIRSKIRSIMSNYSISDIMDNRDAVNTELSNEVSKLFQGKNYSIGVIQFGLADIQPPAIIVKAQETAKEREVAIDTAEAQKAVSWKEAEAKLEVARKQQEIDLLEAETQVLVEQKLSEAVNDAFVTQRGLKILDQLSTNDQKTVILLPMEAFKKPELMMGIHNKALK